jgi:hypothetical protein
MWGLHVLASQGEEQPFMKEAVRPGDPVVIHELRRLGPGPVRAARVIATAAGGTPAGKRLSRNSRPVPP